MGVGVLEQVFQGSSPRALELHQPSILQRDPEEGRGSAPSKNQSRTEPLRLCLLTPSSVPPSSCPPGALHGVAAGLWVLVHTRASVMTWELRAPEVVQ